jgi:hypothetical protein
MHAWFASHWTPDDLPGLRLTIQLYDQVERGDFRRVTECRQHMDGYGITPKGQQDRRWSPPKTQERPEVAETPAASPYEHLRAVV